MRQIGQRGGAGFQIVAPANSGNCFGSTISGTKTDVPNVTSLADS